MSGKVVGDIKVNICIDSETVRGPALNIGALMSQRVPYIGNRRYATNIPSIRSRVIYF